MAVYGLAGVPGMMLGGLLGDAIIRRRRNGRMLVARCPIALKCSGHVFRARAARAGQWTMFGVLFGFGCMMMYVYYATVYSTIQDVIEPSLRATAMALYFAAMYVFGGRSAPRLSARRATTLRDNRRPVVAGVDIETLSAAEKLPYRAQGLNSALYLLPIDVDFFGG